MWHNSWYRSEKSLKRAIHIMKNSISPKKGILTADLVFSTLCNLYRLVIDEEGYLVYHISY